MRPVWLVSVYCLSCVLAQDQDDPCTLDTGGTGSCKILSSCTYAQNLIRGGKRPKLCGFVRLEPIVCCMVKVTGGNEKNKAPFPIFVPNNANVIPRSNGALSKKVSTLPIECLEYYPKPDFSISVAGGEESLAKEFPHMAIIGYGDKENIQWGCGGSLISPNFILTAAHCLNSRGLGPAKWIRLGDLDLDSNEDDALPQDFSVIRNMPHPLYKPSARYHDIALLQLDRNVSLTLYVSPACLHTEPQIKEDKMTATGWGQVEFAGRTSSHLLKVDLDQVPSDKCKESYRNVPTNVIPNGIMGNWQICAGGNVGRDTCQGDSGGPLQIPNKDRTFQVKVHTIMGVTSFGKACAISDSPGVYTRVSNYIPWIESVVWPNEPL